ncbi:MAG: hypothetical protein ACFFAZ_15190 [Promethearchaeota archaeon]
MGKDSTSDILYILGLIGCIMVLVNTVIELQEWTLAASFVAADLLNRFLMGGGFVLVGVGFIGIYRDSGSYVPLLVTVMWPLGQVVSILASSLTSDPNYVYLGMLLIVFLLMGYSVYLFREPIGSFATLASIVFIGWAFGQLIIRFLDPTGTDLFNLQIYWSGQGIIFFIALVYFILAIRSGKS